MMMMTEPGTRCAVPVDTCVCVYCNIIIYKLPMLSVAAPAATATITSIMMTTATNFTNYMH